MNNNDPLVRVVMHASEWRVVQEVLNEEAAALEDQVLESEGATEDRLVLVNTAIGEIERALHEG